MSITREFLGMEQPGLVSASDFLLRQYAKGSDADLRGVRVVVPGARAGRRLLEILVDRAEADSLTFAPPQITTAGQLPELLYQAKRPFAEDLVQHLAWSDALRKFDRAKLAAVVAERPDDEDAERWLDLGRLLQTLHRELASAGLDFASLVARGRSLHGFTEGERWQALAEIQRAYLDTLDSLGLWDRQTARLFAIEHGECRSGEPIVLIAAVDLNQSMRQMLDQVADQITALIYAPDDQADRFDAYGCLVADAWQNVELPIQDDSLLEADNPVDQSELVARRIAQFGARFLAEEITVGLPDERIVSQLVRQLDECKLPNRYGPGQPLARTGVCRMLDDLAAFARSGRYADFARLVRNPDIEAWLLQTGAESAWLEELDAYYNEHLPSQIDGVWLGDHQCSSRLRDASERIARLTKRLQDSPRALDQWLSGIGRILTNVYGDRDFDLENGADHRAWKACGAVQDALGELARIPQALMPDVDGTDALRMALDLVSAQRMAPTAHEAAIELVGWLELPLDDAPALIVTSFNEGFVPSSAGADMFLPESLRSALGLNDNARRYARDAYAVTTLLAPWRSTTFIVARRDQDDDPLPPSRLLFAASPVTVARRALRLFAEAPKRPVRQPLAGGLPGSRTESAFNVPRPLPLPEPITRMSVTSFKTYLACPYRFFLSRVLKLDRIDDDATELDGATFGSLAHAVLEQFAAGDVRDDTNARTIQRELDHLLDKLVRNRFGEHPRAAILVQIEQLRLRLQAMSRWQADRAAQGWRIEHAELSFSDRPGRLAVDGEPMLLTGRIDRIDVNQKTGERLILDYKTSDAGESPKKTHRKRSGNWIDLQLPMYRHLARELGIDDPVGLGYIVLPKNIANVGLSMAEWTEADLDAADQAACEVVRQIRAQVFWPPTDPPPAYSEDFAPICMDGVFGRKT